MLLVFFIVGTIVVFVYRLLTNPEGLFVGEDSADLSEWFILVIAIIVVIAFFYGVTSGE